MKLAGIICHTVSLGVYSGIEHASVYTVGSYTCCLHSWLKHLASLHICPLTANLNYSQSTPQKKISLRPHCIL